MTEKQIHNINGHYDHVPLPREDWLEIDIIDGAITALTPEIRQGRERFRNFDYDWKKTPGFGRQYSGSPATPILQASKTKRSLKREDHFAIENQKLAKESLNDRD